MVESDTQDNYYEAINGLLDSALPGRGSIVKPSQKQLDDYADFNGDERPARLDRYRLADMYYDGTQVSQLTDRLKQYLETQPGVTYNENICQAVADAYIERFTVVGITTSLDEPAPPEPPPALPRPGDAVLAPGEPPPPPPAAPEPKEKPLDLAGWLWERVWDGSQGDQRQIETHQDMGRRGDAFVIVDYDADRRRSTLVRQLPDQMRVIYKNGQKSMAIKKWYTDDVAPTNPSGRKVCRMNLYYPDRIEKWFKIHKADDQGGGWLEWLDDGDEKWPVPWTYLGDGEDGQKALGIPVYHFANGADDSGYGRAEHRIVVPLQDRLNKELIDLSSILDQMGWPQRWAVGVENTDNLKAEPGTVWSTPATGADGATFGQFEAAPVEGAISSIENTMSRASTISRTPKYMLELSGGTPSGEALKTAESGLVSKVQGRQPFIGNQWAEALRMAAILALVYGGTAKDEKPPVKIDDVLSCSINIVWKDPRTFDEKAHLEALQIMQTLGIPEEYLWSRIEGIDVEAVKALKTTSDARNAALLVSSFNRGGDTNPAEPGQGVPPGLQ